MCVDFVGFLLYPIHDLNWFQVSENIVEEELTRTAAYEYPDMKKSFDNGFSLQVQKGEFSDSEIIVMLGQNGMHSTPSLHYPHRHHPH